MVYVILYFSINIQYIMMQYFFSGQSGEKEPRIKYY